MRQLEAVAVVPAPPEAIFAFLSDLRNHWAVADRFVEVVRVEGSSGVVRVGGPLGLRRTASTKVERTVPPALIVGTADMDGRTRARVSWTLAPVDGGTTVRLAADVERAAPLDRLLLVLGGRMWLERRFASALDHLARRFDATMALSHRYARPIDHRAAETRP